MAQAKLKQWVIEMEMQNEGPENAGTTSEQRGNLQNAKAAGWLALAERCKKAIGPDREIDKAISKAATGDSSLTPHTASLDAITALIERELPGARWTGGCYVPLPTFRIDLADGNLFHPAGYGSAATPALALCAAFCRAMAEKESRS